MLLRNPLRSSLDDRNLPPTQGTISIAGSEPHSVQDVPIFSTHIAGTHSRDFHDGKSLSLPESVDHPLIGERRARCSH
jgi:hypothetical protein